MNDDSRDRTGNAADATEAFARMWTDFAAKMSQAAASATAAGKTSGPELPPEMARMFRDTFFRSMGEYVEEFMRSPEFLQMMRESLRQSIQTRKQINDWLGQVWHEFQGTSRQDVDQIMLVMRHVEQRMVEEFEKVQEHVGELHRRLDDLEQKVEAAEQGRATRSSAKQSAAGTSGTKKSATKKAATKKPSGRKKS